MLIGDSSHAIVPFYGQGMNASFEDVVVLDEILAQNTAHPSNGKLDWGVVFKAYEKARKHDTDAIADLALDNFHEMKKHVANPLFKEKRMIEMALEKTFPTQYASKYSLVTFNANIGYDEAMKRGRAQDKALLRLIANNAISMTPSMTNEALELILYTVIKETNLLLEQDHSFEM